MKKKMVPVLTYLENMIDGKLKSNEITFMTYPTNISKTLNMKIEKVALGQATLSIDADPLLHANQQNTIHGGLMCELADQAIGTAHSTLIKEDETFSSVDLKINFLYPWNDPKIVDTFLFS